MSSNLTKCDPLMVTEHAQAAADQYEQSISHLDHEDRAAALDELLISIRQIRRSIDDETQ